jgi:hypothetical protein
MGDATVVALDGMSRHGWRGKGRGEGHRRICMGECREQNRHIGRSTLRGREENLGEKLMYVYMTCEDKMSV